MIKLSHYLDLDHYTDMDYIIPILKSGGQDADSPTWYIGLVKLMKD